MSSLYPQVLQSYLDIFLVFVRLLGFFVLVPVFSHQTISPHIKLAVALSLSLVIYPLVRPFLGGVPLSTGGMIASVLRETVIGFLMGFVAYVTFEGINLSAQFVGVQMGLGTAGLMDPQNHSNVSVWVPIHSWLALMVFLLTDMHHTMIGLFVSSFELTKTVELSSFGGQPLLNAFVATSTKLFVIAVQMAAPFTFLILGMNVVMGMLSRLMPQMNMMLFSFSLTILLGFGGLYLVAPELIDYFENHFSEFGSEVVGILRTL